MIKTSNIIYIVLGVFVRQSEWRECGDLLSLEILKRLLSCMQKNIFISSAVCELVTYRTEDWASQSKGKFYSCTSEQKAFKILNFADYTANNAELDKYKVINMNFSISRFAFEIVRRMYLQLFKTLGTVHIYRYSILYSDFLRKHFIDYCVYVKAFS